MKDIHEFFNRLRTDEGAIWLENESIKLSTSKKLQNTVTKEFIITNKYQIISILNDNKIFSKEQFLKVAIFKDRITNHYPLSPAQERLWFIEQYEQGSNAYHIPIVFELDVNTNIKAIKYALQQIVSRHEILRSTIEQAGDQEQGTQQVHQDPLLIEAVKLKNQRAYRSLIKNDINQPFDLSNSYPIRVKFYTVQSKKAASVFPAKRIFLLINIHHIASDGWSAEIFEKELLAFYQAFVTKDRSFCLPELEIQYKDYALWQKAFLTGPSIEKQLRYWKRKLSNFQDLEMPSDFVRPNRVDYKGAHEKFVINKQLSQQVRILAQQYGTTVHCVLLSSINILLNKYTGQDDIVIGSPIANRHHKETEGLIGFFVNMQVNRTRLNKFQNFASLVKQVTQEQGQAQLYQDLPFEKLVDELGLERDTSRHPVFQVMFAVQHFGEQASRNKQKFSHKRSQAEDLYGVEKFDLSICIDDSHADLTGQISYATSLFRKDTVLRFIDHYIHLLDQLIKAPEKPYGQFGLLKPAEYRQIIYQWNRTYKNYPKDITICQLFQHQVQKFPGNTALVYEGQQLTYHQLNEKSNQLARYIRRQYKKRTKKDLAPGTLMALCVDKSLEMIIGILAVLKAGGAYVPLDINHPEERIDYLVKDSGAALILSQRKLINNSNIKLLTEKVVCIDLAEACYKKEDTQNLPPQSQATDLAYVIYTSGTTGRPKGVKIAHSSLINLVSTQKTRVQINSKSNVLQYASLIFDASVWEIFSALSVGAKLSIVPILVRQDVQLFCDYLADEKISIALLPPALLNRMPYTRLPDLKTVLVGGDVCPLETMKTWSQGRKLINAYGPTENTVITTMHTYAEGDKNANIGKPVANNKLYVLDSNLTPVPVGVTGELCIGGMGLTTGYINKNELTEESFIHNLFATPADKVKGHTRLYKSGDLVRWTPDGNLEYIGRNDDQVKIRGFRIALGEIEHAMSQIKGIRQCCVLAREKKTATGSDKYLVGYYVLDNSNVSISQASITNKLAQVLPEYMVPGIFIAMESFPVTGNGKLDRSAFPDADFNAPKEEYVAPTNETEMLVCKIWGKMLGLERVGVTDNFFRIGGNSILAMQVAYRMSKALGNYIKVADLFRLKSISNLLAARDQYFKLVTPYHTDQNKSLGNMIFIHPGHGGSEVYQGLAELLSSSYNCIGIDNYNVHHKEQIRSLNKLAQHYLSAYQNLYTITEPVNLLGWSLGGLIALEMAAVLEVQGRRDINVFLLDTFVSAGKLDKNKGTLKKNKQQRLYTDPYFKNAAAALETAMDLTNQSVSRYLQHTNVTLFRATETTVKQKRSNVSGAAVKKRTVNNIDLVAGKVRVIDLHCFHNDILDINSATISNHIISRQIREKRMLEVNKQHRKII